MCEHSLDAEPGLRVLQEEPGPQPQGLSGALGGPRRALTHGEGNTDLPPGAEGRHTHIHTHTGLGRSQERDTDLFPRAEGRHTHTTQDTAHVRVEA